MIRSDKILHEMISPNEYLLYIYLQDLHLNVPIIKGILVDLGI